MSLGDNDRCSVATTLSYDSSCSAAPGLIIPEHASYESLSSYPLLGDQLETKSASYLLEPPLPIYQNSLNHPGNYPYSPSPCSATLETQNDYQYYSPNPIDGDQDAQIIQITEPQLITPEPVHLHDHSSARHQVLGDSSFLHSTPTLCYSTTSLSTTSNASDCKEYLLLPVPVVAIGNYSNGHKKKTKILWASRKDLKADLKSLLLRCSLMVLFGFIVCLPFVIPLWTNPPAKDDVK